MASKGTNTTLDDKDGRIWVSNGIRFQKLRVISALVLREMAARYGKSWGGYFWAVAEPAGGIFLLAMVFGFILRSPPLGNSFVVFYATGIIPYYLYNSVATSSATALNSNRGLLTYPVVSALDTVIARLIIEVLNYVMITAVLFPALILYDHAIVNFEPANVVMSLTMAASIGLGVGTLNAVINGFFPTWRNIWGVLNRPLFMLSGSMFTYEMLPEPYKTYVWYNPLIQVIGEMRLGFYAGYNGDYVSPAYVFGIAFSVFVIGAYLLRRHEGYLVER